VVRDSSSLGPPDVALAAGPGILIALLPGSRVLQLSALCLGVVVKTTLPGCDGAPPGWIGANAFGFEIKNT